MLCRVQPDVSLLSHVCPDHATAVSLQCLVELLVIIASTPHKSAYGELYPVMTSAAGLDIWSLRDLSSTPEDEVF